MAQCVAIDSNGFLIADATPVASCTGWVVATSTEFQDMQGIFQPLALNDGVVIGTAVLGAFATAWVFRMLRDVVRGGATGEGE